MQGRTASPQALTPPDTFPPQLSRPVSRLAFLLISRSEGARGGGRPWTHVMSRRGHQE